MGNGLLREAVAPGDNWGDYNTLGDEVTHERNSWNIGYGTFTVDPDASTTPSDPSRGGFETLADTDAYAPRDPDAFADLTADSPFVDAGRSLGDAYPDSSTDLGAFPYDASSGPTASLSVVTGSGFATPAAVRVLDGDQWVPGAVRVRAADGDGFVEAFGATGGTVAAATGSGSSDVSTAYVEAFDRASPLDDYVGTPAAFEVTDRAFVGAHALRHTAPGDDHLVLRGDGDGAIPRGEDVRVRMYAHETGNYGKLYVCASGSSYADVSGYAVEYDAATSVSPALKLLRYDDGTLTALDETPLDPPTGEWLSIELYTTEGRLAAGLSRADGTQLAAVRAVDDTYRTGTYGFGCNDPGVSFDALERL
jgi:chitodextrinase